MEQSNLNVPAESLLVGCNSVAELAQLEGWTPDEYALTLSEHIRDSRVPFDTARERLAALASLAPGLGDKTSAEELSRHGAILESLFHFMARQAFEVSAKDPIRHSAASERYLGMAIKAQRANLSVHSALAVLRQQALTTSPAATQRCGEDPTALDQT